jgi:hypothetical protein
VVSLMAASGPLQPFVRPNTTSAFERKAEYHIFGWSWRRNCPRADSDGFDRQSSGGKLAGPADHQADAGVGAFWSIRFCRFSSAQNPGAIVVCIELTLARTCAEVCAPTINAAATSGSAAN